MSNSAPTNASPVGNIGCPGIRKGQNSESSTTFPELATAKLAGDGATGKDTELAQNATRSFASALGAKG